MTWKAFHSRAEVLRAVIDAADARRDGRLPMDVEGVAGAFDGELDLLAALQLKWHTRLAGRIERVFADQPMDLPDAVVQAWRESARELPGVRRVLDRHRDHPLDDAMAAAMSVATDKEHVFLAVMAGRSSLADDAARVVGADLEERARRGVDAAATVTETSRRPRLLDRLRAVVAA
ncbi:hypothetical protein [Nocardioides sambongensis]|uniref:hypothetical protein n=1 Tax=Nocardioides sambongensis TaxID=2589074 RepID=UPI00112AAAD7|nr:hypothetical protein [Nocardioides sambongensis]